MSISENQDELFVFEDVSRNEEDDTVKTWKVLSVEDDTCYQETLALTVKNMVIDGRHVEFMTASSATTAASIIAQHSDIAVILLDVIMERELAGLYLAETIRNVIGNNEVRIILLTGQASTVPREDIMHSYNIDEYWQKAELTAEKLKSVLTSNVRTWSNIHDLNIARRGLQMIVDASRALTKKSDITTFTETVLHEVAKVLNLPNTGGFVCTFQAFDTEIEAFPIIATSGHYQHADHRSFNALFQHYSPQVSEKIKTSIECAVESKQHQFAHFYTVLYFETISFEQTEKYVIFIDSAKPLEDGHIKLLQVFSENISTSFSNINLLNKLTNLAYQDRSINIPNRNWLLRELDSLTSEERHKLSLVRVELNDQSSMEMILGTSYTSLILKGILDNLRKLCPHYYCIAKPDDDAFVLLFKKQNLPNNHILHLLSDQIININNLDHQVILNVGVVNLDEVDEKSAERIFALSEIALQHGRQNNQAVTYFDREQVEMLSRRSTMLHDLNGCIAQEKGLFLVFQPKVDMRSGRPVGIEALIRWKRHDGTLVPPGEFIPLVEASGLMAKIDTFVMQKTIATIQALQQEGYALPVSFNVTCNDITNRQFVAALHEIIAVSGISPQLLEIEVTESLAMEDYQLVNPILQELIDTGMSVSIDDFGTGYSSLAHITDLAATTLKVDRKFIDDLTGSKSEQATHVVQIVQKLSSRFNFNLVAEGIETQEQCQILIQNGYVIGQGYYFAKPMEWQKLLAWLEEFPPL